jgi:hypothetical protein
LLLPHNIEGRDAVAGLVHADETELFQQLRMICTMVW